MPERAWSRGVPPHSETIVLGYMGDNPARHRTQTGTTGIVENILRGSNKGEAMSLIEGGFQYVTEMDGMKLFKKRK